MSRIATLEIDGKKYEFPIVEGTENEIAIESALKVEMAENFMNGVKELFKESYVEIPEDKIDHVSNMESELTEVKKKLDEAVNDQIELKKTIKDQNY